MPKINREEYEHLKGLYSKREWIARDEDKGLWAYNPRPYKLQGEWQGCPSTELNSDLFQFIQWENEEPYNIQELINDFEEAKRINKPFRDSLHKALDEVHEREETEVKDKTWLKEKIEKIDVETSEDFPHYEVISKEVVLNEIDQLDEPQKVVVPQFVGDFIDEYKDQGYTLSNAIFNISRGDEDLDIEEYFRENPRTCIDAWDNGYTVEKEQKHYVKDDKGNILLMKVTKGFGIDDRKGEVVNSLNVGEASDIRLTEKEIKDYDPKYMAFAVPAEEEEG